MGLYADLSELPPRGFDISQFRYFEARIKLSRPVIDSSISVEFVLYPVEISAPKYTFPTYEAQVHELSTDWVTVRADFSEFVSPRIHTGTFNFDLNTIYRVGVSVKAEPMHKTHGHLDIDFIKFAR